MMSLRKPSPKLIAEHLLRQRESPLSYDFEGLSRTIPQAATPAGYLLDHRREQIGTGDAAWERAKLAIDQFVMFQNGWTELHAPQGPPRVGNVVGMLVWIGGLWWLNPARVLYEVDETTNSGTKRFGFAYGTLAEHVERGEERFWVEQEPDGSVWYDLASFSQPRHPLVRLFSPLARRIQLRFGRDSMQVMRRFVSGSP
jgi:uncharacterized protein (UPF0548 family)